MCVEGGIFFKINKRDSTFIREMRVTILSSISLDYKKGKLQDLYIMTLTTPNM